MRSLEANRLRERWRYVSTVTLLTLLISVLGAILPTSAFASTWPGPDDGAGNYAHCNINVWSTGGTGYQFGVACQYTMQDNSSVQHSDAIVSYIQWNWATTCSSGCTSGSGSDTFQSGGTTCIFAAGCSVPLTGGVDSTGNLAGKSSTAAATGTYSAVSFNTCKIKTNYRTALQNCTFDTVSRNTTGVPITPTNNYPGGTAGPSLDSTIGTSSCSRTLTDTSTMTGEFTAGRTGMANATVTAWDWNWGDSTTHGTAQNMNHTYGALSTMPNAGWTATVTMTVTSTSGHLFSDGTSSQTGTCQLRVDFLHPEDMTAGSTGGSGTGNATLDSCIPSGWNVLNPIALIGGVGCLLQKLFIPSSTTTDGLGHLWDTVTTHLPFSIVTGFVNYIPNMWDDFKWNLENVSPLTTSHHLGGVHDPSPLCTQTKGGDMPNGSPLNLCPGADTMPFQSIASSTFITFLRAFFLFVLVAIFVYAMWRGANEILT